MLLLTDEIKQESFRMIKRRIQHISGQGWWYELRSIQFLEGGLEAAAAALEKSAPMDTDWLCDPGKFTADQIRKSSTEAGVLATLMSYRERNGKLTAESEELEYRLRLVNCTDNMGFTVHPEIIGDGMLPSMDTKIEKWEKEARELNHKFYKSTDPRGHLSGIILQLIGEREEVRPVIAALEQYHAGKEEQKRIAAEMDESRHGLNELSDNDLPF